MINANDRANVQTFQSAQAHIRNFSIIAHIDHGKTTLTDAFLRLTHTVTNQDFQERMMDSNPIERERGITIKLAPVRMEYMYQSGAVSNADTKPQNYILNLIDTPGHVDFGYEVSRSLAACEGALLLIDASQGIQAQTLSNFEKASQLGLTIIPVINKIDLPAADAEAVMLECMETFGFVESDFLKVSAKTRLGIEAVLQAIVERIPAPDGDPDAPLRALVMTSVFDQHKGAIAYLRVVDGRLEAGTKLALKATGLEFSSNDIGVFLPARQPIPLLKTGEVGYLATGVKELQYVQIGDTLTTAEDAKMVKQLPGFKLPQPMVYMELYPVDADDFTLLQDAMSKLALHDASLRSTGTHSQALGNGLRVGFLGILHAEIVTERLWREFNLELIATAPSVSYQVRLTTGETVTVNTPAELPDPSQIQTIREPITKTIIFTPEDRTSRILQFVRERRGELLNSTFMGTRMRLEYRLPLAEIITDFHDTLKSISSGFASMEYEVIGYDAVNAVKITIMVNKEVVEALSTIVVKDKAEQIGRAIVKKLKEVVPRQQFEVPIQAALGGTIVARETIKAYRKDVTAKLYGGDVTRRMKLLRKQAKGKKRLKQFGKVELNQEAFLAVLKRE